MERIRCGEHISIHQGHDPIKILLSALKSSTVIGANTFNMTETLTEHLLSISPSQFQAATQHPFLAAAARASLPQKQLVQWLAQDRLYAISYVTFIGQLLSKVAIPTAADRRSTLNWRIANCLIDCLTNIRRELKLFEDTAKENDWTDDLGNAGPDIATQAYKDVFAGAGQPVASLLRGMVTLWATEKCYLAAWTHAKDQMQSASAGDRSVMQRVFIPNWSSKEFVEFVKVLEDLVDEMGKTARVEDIKEAELAWRQVVWAEEAFWPKVE